MRISCGVIRGGNPLGRRKSFWRQIGIVPSTTSRSAAFACDLHLGSNACKSTSRFFRHDQVNQPGIRRCRANESRCPSITLLVGLCRSEQTTRCLGPTCGGMPLLHRGWPDFAFFLNQLREDWAQTLGDGTISNKQGSCTQRSTDT